MPHTSLSLKLKTHHFTLGFFTWDHASRSLVYRTGTEVPSSSFANTKKRAVRVSAISPEGTTHLGILDCDAEADIEQVKKSLEWLNEDNRYCVLPGFSGKTVKIFFLVKTPAKRKETILNAINQVIGCLEAVTGLKHDSMGGNWSALNRSQFKALSEWLDSKPAYTVYQKGKRSTTKNVSGDFATPLYRKHTLYTGRLPRHWTNRHSESEVKVMRYIFGNLKYAMSGLNIPLHKVNANTGLSTRTVSKCLKKFIDEGSLECIDTNFKYMKQARKYKLSGDMLVYAESIFSRMESRIGPAEEIVIEDGTWNLELFKLTNYFKTYDDYEAYCLKIPGIDDKADRKTSLKHKWQYHLDHQNIKTTINSPKIA